MIYFPRGQSNPSINNATQSTIFRCFTKILLWLVPKHTVSVNQLKKKSPTILVTSANGTFYFPVFSASSIYMILFSFLLVVIIVETGILMHQKPKFL